MSGFKGGQVLQTSSPLQKCSRCGRVLPCDVGQKFNNCEEWGEQTLKKIPMPCNIQLFIDLGNHGLLCRIAGMMQNEAAFSREIPHKMDIEIDKKSSKSRGIL